MRLVTFLGLPELRLLGFTIQLDIYLDVCGLELPEPMEQVLEALSVLAPAQRVRMVIDREPRPLFRILETNGFGNTAELRPDYLYEILIWHRL